MRFCMVTTFYPPYNYGGDGTYVRALARQLVARGHEVEVIACSDAYLLRSPEPAIPERDGDDGVTVHRLAGRFRALGPLVMQQTGHPGLFGAALRRLLDRRFDVIHFHNISLIGGPAVLTMGNAPVRLFSLHEHWLICPTHILWKHRSRACDRPTCFTCSIRSGLPPQLWRYTGLRDRALAHVDRLLSPSVFAAEKHRDEGITAPIAVLPLFSSIASPPEVERYDATAPGFVFVGRVTASKGIEQLLRIARTAPMLRITVIGDGDLHPALQAAYRDVPNIRFLGRLPQAELVQHLAAATALVLPSIVPETFGLSVIEASACGTPAIVSRGAGGAADIIEETGGGLLYQNDAELAAAMHRLAAAPDLRDALGLVAQRGYHALYTPERHMTAYLAHVAEIMALKQGDAARRPCTQ